MAASDPSDLMGQIFNFFRHLYPSTAPDAFLVFEHLGLPINPADYQLNGAPCPPLALELTSRMCNQPWSSQAAVPTMPRRPWTG